MSKPLVIQTEALDPQAAQWLGERCDLRVCPWPHIEQIDLWLPRASGLVVRTYTQVGPGMLDRAPHLKVVGRAGVGLDNINVPECRARGVEVVYTPDANSSAVTELVIAVTLDSLRPRLFLDAPLDHTRWNELRKELTGTTQLEGLTFGVLGLGRVGSRVARAAAAFGARVLFHDLLDIPEDRRHGATPVPMDQLLAESRVLSIHVDGRASNHGLLGRAHLARLRPDALLINTSRGFVLDAHALADFLRTHPSASAVLDVHEPEPITPDNPLLGLPNAHLMPHIGAATAQAHANMSWVVRDVWRVLSGERPRFPAPEG